MNYQVYHEGFPQGKPRFYDDCWLYILKNQGQSVDWARKWGGWQILPAKEEANRVATH